MVARFLAAVSRWFGATLVELEANGRAAVLIGREGAPFALLTVDASQSGIDRIFWVMSPDRLAASVRSSRPRKP